MVLLITKQSSDIESWDWSKIKFIHLFLKDKMQGVAPE